MNMSKVSNNEVKFEIYEIIKFSFEMWDIKALKYIKNLKFILWIKSIF